MISLRTVLEYDESRAGRIWMAACRLQGCFPRKDSYRALHLLTIATLLLRLENSFPHSGTSEILVLSFQSVVCVEVIRYATLNVVRCFSLSRCESFGLAKETPAWRFHCLLSCHKLFDDGLTPVSKYYSRCGVSIAMETTVVLRAFRDVDADHSSGILTSSPPHFTLITLTSL